MINPTGSKLWRLKYRHMGKEKLLAIGTYPLISLADARESRDGAKKLLAIGKDPMAEKKHKRRQAIRNANNTFEAVALEWHEKKKSSWSVSHTQQIKRKLEIDVFPRIGSRPIAEIEPPELLQEVLQRIEKRDALEIAQKVKQICGMVYHHRSAYSRSHATQDASCYSTKRCTSPACYRNRADAVIS